jgi:hypothetical protein
MGPENERRATGGAWGFCAVNQGKEKTKAHFGAKALKLWVRALLVHGNFYCVKRRILPVSDIAPAIRA